MIQGGEPSGGEAPRNVLDEARGNGFVWVAAALLLLAIGYRLTRNTPPTRPPVEVFEAPVEREGGGGKRLYVHVAGAVRRPGLYRLPAGARVAAAIELAGGPRKRADLTTTNLAAKVEDGQQVIVPLRGKVVAAAPAAGGPAATAAGPISLATATQAQLEELDGIGPALAQAILAYRDANGGFRSVEELQEVDGIGEKRFEALREAVQP